jgi:hypothetical protein
MRGPCIGSSDSVRMSTDNVSIAHASSRQLAAVTTAQHNEADAGGYNDDIQVTY